MRAAAELIIGNLDENGYLTASDEEMAHALQAALAEEAKSALRAEPIPFERGLRAKADARAGASSNAKVSESESLCDELQDRVPSDPGLRRVAMLSGGAGAGADASTRPGGGGLRGICGSAC